MAWHWDEFWVTVAYFIFGAAGTMGRVILSPTIKAFRSDSSWVPTPRFLVEALSGGVAGFVVPHFGKLLVQSVPMLTNGATVEHLPFYIKGGIVFLLNVTGSMVIGDILGWRKRSWHRGEEP